MRPVFCETLGNYNIRHRSSEDQVHISAHRSSSLAMHPLLILYGFFSFCELALFSAASPYHSSLNSSNAQILYCFRDKDWTKPRWPATVDQPYTSIVYHLRAAYVLRYPQVLFEFLPIGEIPTLGLPVVRTPFKLVLGMNPLQIDFIPRKKDILESFIQFTRLGTGLLITVSCRAGDTCSDYDPRFCSPGPQRPTRFRTWPLSTIRSKPMDASLHFGYRVKK